MNRVLFALLLFGGFLTGCENLDDEFSPTSLEGDEALIESLAMSSDRIEVDYEVLPEVTAESIDLNHFETFVETVERVSGAGFIVSLGNGEVLYADENGRMLEYRRAFVSAEVFRGRHPHGRCFRRLVRFGRRLPPAELGELVTGYVAENYPDVRVRAAKELGDSTLVLISGPTVLLFGADDEFLREWNPLEHCSNFCRDLRPAVQATIRTYLEENFPGIEARRACARNGKVFVLVTNVERRTILVFDIRGNYLGRRP